MKTLYGVKKNSVDAFGYNSADLDEIWSTSIVGGWPWQVLGTIRAVATVWEAAESLFFGQVNNAQFRRFPVG